MKHFMRVRAEIDLDAVLYNLKSMRSKLPEDTRMFAVIKTDGYGHGAVEIAKEIEDEPYLHGFCVATAEEGAELRRSGVKKEILILGYTFPESYPLILEHELTATIFTEEAAKALSAAAKDAGKEVHAHLAIDTGMSRIGLQVTEEDADLAKRIAEYPNLSLDGIFTHFARADERDKTFAREQFSLFLSMMEKLKKRGLTFPIRHAANSASIMELPETALDAVRAGITLYGILPSDEVAPKALSMKPVMSLTSHVSHVKTLTEGRQISYGGTYTVKKETVVATVPVGYGDGYPRSLSNCGYVLIRGQKAKILGRVCMDQFMVDVTEIPGVTVGDAVRLLGTQGEETISIEELGALSERFPYELACDIGKRVPRVFIKNGEMVSVREAF